MKAIVMDVRIKKLIKPMIIIAVIIIAVCLIINKPVTWDDIFSYVGYAISGVSILFVVYEKWLWRVIPWNRPPVFCKKYDGTISYVFNGQPGSKQILIEIKQSLLSVEIKTKTDINSSYSATGSIVQEHDADILYYTYVTNPPILNQAENPIQWGTCRMILNKEMDHLKGFYWTSRQTIGDIEWQKADGSRS